MKEGLRDPRGCLKRVPINRVCSDSNHCTSYKESICITTSKKAPDCFSLDREIPEPVRILISAWKEGYYVIRERDEMKHLSKRTNRRVYDSEPNSSSPILSEKDYFGEITVNENHIYMYQGITPRSVMEMGIAIRNIGQQIINLVTELDLSVAPSIHLHINSGGGCVFSGLAGASHVLESRVPVHTYVEGSTPLQQLLFLVQVLNVI